MSSLETSITLDDVFAVVAVRRVPLAAELAGYLALEIADGTDAGSGEVDPKTVFISEEGTVALVRPKKESVSGDAEASVRQLLIRLLEASGSSTPALGTAAKRKPGNGLPALVEELEAALIPVNRAAGRRALARLSREVKRVTQGVGRNASSAAPVPPATAPAPAPAKQLSAPPPPPLPPPPPPPPEPVKAEAPKVEPPKVEAEAPKHDPLAATPIAPKPKGTSIPPPPVKGAASGPPPPPPQPKREPGPPSALYAETPPPAPSPLPSRESRPPPIPTPAPVRSRNDEIDALIGSFGVSQATEDKQMARDLKAMAGLSPTPPHPEAKSLGNASGSARGAAGEDITLADLADDVGKGPLPRRMDGEGDSVEALLAMADASLPAPDVSLNVGIPPVKTPAANLPPSSVLGASSAGAAAAGAPAVLRQSGHALPGASAAATPAPASSPGAKKGDSKEVFQRTSPTDASDPAAATQRRKAHDPPRAPKTSMAMLILALIALGGATIAIYKYAPHVFVGHKPVQPTAPVPSAAIVRAPACKLSLVVTDVAPRAEVLLRVGQAPVDVDHMPVGARLELVATAEGYAPRRAVVAAESVWDKGADGKPRIEVPIQLDASHPKPGTIDPWPVAEANSQVGGSGVPGTVHVVSNVRGAEVWLLAGLGPEARMEQRCDGDVDVLVAGEKGLRKRIHVGEKEIAAAGPDAQGNKVVTVSAR